MQRDGTPSPPPDWLAEAMEGEILAARRARWGFRHETWIVERRDGRTAVVQLRADGTDPTGPRQRAVRDLVRSGGLPVPEPVRTVRSARGLVVWLPRVEGKVSAELLATTEGAALVGRLCGEIATSLGRLDPGQLALPRAWASGDGLRAAMRANLDGLSDPLPTAVRGELLLAVDRAASEVDLVAPRVVHGDLAPVNVLVRDDRLAAVLDFDRVHLAHPDYDAAWFAWVVSFHHPDVADRACEAFGLALSRQARPRANLVWMWPLQLLERVAEAQSPLERTMWQDRLASLRGLSQFDPG
jgi:aminoglycoside phosphotransferase (APT) family kinase protein